MQQATKERRLPVSTRVAWTALSDVKVLKACIPGCASLTAMSPTEFMVTVIAGIGPLKMTVKGTIELQRHGDDDPPASYTLYFDGYGRLLGRAQGEAHVQLRPAAEGGTILRYGAKARVSGRIAAAGASIIDIAVQELTESFFSRLSDHIREFEREIETAGAG